MDGGILAPYTLSILVCAGPLRAGGPAQRDHRSSTCTCNGLRGRSRRGAALGSVLNGNRHVGRVCIIIQKHFIGLDTPTSYRLWYLSAFQDSVKTFVVSGLEFLAGAWTHSNWRTLVKTLSRSTQQRRRPTLILSNFKACGLDTPPLIKTLGSRAKRFEL